MARKVAVCGICTVMGVLSLYLASIIRTNTIFILGLSAFFVAVSVIEGGVLYGIATYISSSLLAFFLVLDKVLLLPYVLFAGIYPIVKAFIERINNLVIEWIIKIIFFWAAIYGVSKFYFPQISIPLYLTAAIVTMVFAIFDLALSYGISFYIKKIKNIFKNG